MGSERRRAERVRHRMVARFFDGGKKQTAVVLNFSEAGLFLQTRHPLPLGSTVKLELGSGQTIEVAGKVVWQQAIQAAEAALGNPGVGIALEDIPEQYRDLVKKLRKQLKGAPRATETRHVVRQKVRLQAGSELFADYIENLSRGGMFVATGKPLEPGTILHAVLEIPGFEEPIELEGRVAFILDETRAKAQARAPGIGVQFLNLTPNTQARLHHYIRRLEIHRERPQRRLGEDLPASGSLGDCLVPEILAALLAQQRSGVLTLERKGIRKTIYVRKGQPIYADSSLRSETFGQYLVRLGKIPSERMTEIIPALGTKDFRLGEYLIREGLLDGATLATLLVEQHADKIMSTFPWFEGTFEFEAKEDFGPGISTFAMDPYKLLLEGIPRWYDPTMVRAWAGVDERSVVRRTGAAPEDVPLPPVARRMLSHLAKPRSISDLATDLKAHSDELVSLAYGLMVLGWLELKVGDSLSETSEPSVPVAPKKAPKKTISPGAATVLARRVEQDLERLRKLDFYEILRVRPGVVETDLTRAFVEITAKYPLEEIRALESEEARRNGEALLALIRLAYDTLRDPKLRHIYSQRGAKRGPADRREANLEIERLLLGGIQLMEKDDFTAAADRFHEGAKKYPEDATLSGYLGWALFKVNAKENLKRSVELLDLALDRDVGDPHLYYFRAEVYAYVGNWRLAERFAEKALRLLPNHPKAAAARDRAQEKRIAQERQARKIS